jgi:hypothetical protein
MKQIAGDRNVVATRFIIHSLTVACVAERNCIGCPKRCREESLKITVVR